IPHRAPPPRDISPGPWLAGITVIAVVAAGSWWWMSSGPQWLDDPAQPAVPAPMADGEEPRQASGSEPEEDEAQATMRQPEDVPMETGEPVAGEPSRQDVAQAQ